jgi:hypothetical protein
MRTFKSSSRASRSVDELRERYLGEIAPLLDAARGVECLSSERKRKVRRRIMRTAFGTRWLGLRMRLAPAVIVLAALVVGGAAFAAAERLGLIPGMGKAPLPAVPSTTRSHSEKRRAPVNAQPPPVLARAPETVILPEVSDPLLLALPAASTFGWRVWSDSVVAEAGDALAAERPSSRSEVGPRVPSGKATRSVLRRLAYAVPVPVTPAPSNDLFAQPLSDSGPAATPIVAPATAPSAAPSVAPTVVPSPADSGTSPVRPVALVKDDLRSVPSDAVLFGQAMRRLRMEHDPSGALMALQAHERAYPRSSLSAERDALEVESLLALHRDREALSRLDTIALDVLPRGGERLVVRGELRAAARRWPEASADFDQALSRVSGSPAWYERALWGRAVARLRCGEREAGLADVESYRDRYPNGRFAAEAKRFLDHR